MTERFNVAGAMLVKLFGGPENEQRVFAGRAAKVRDIGVITAMYGSTLFIALTPARVAWPRRSSTASAAGWSSTAPSSSAPWSR